MMLRRKAVVLGLCSASMLLNTGCWWERYTYQSSALIRTYTQEEDLILGTQLFPDPNRGYYGQRTTSIEKYGYTSVNGRTNGYAEDFRSNLSVPNDWTFWNTDGACANMVTYQNRLVHGGTADLKCRVFTGYNRSEYTPIGLEGDTLDGDGWYVPEPDDLGTNFLWSNQEMGPHQALRSGNGNYQLVLLDDGNLVQFYNGNDGRWDTGTSNGARLVMQGDGNLVLYTSWWSPVWASNTAGNPGAYLNVQDDGNLVVYSANNQRLWSLW